MALHVKGALTAGLGSICKGALFCPPATLILLLSYGGTYRQQAVESGWNYRHFLTVVTAPLLPWARRHHRLTFCLAATYANTLCKCAEDHLQQHPSALDLLAEETTGQVVDAWSVLLACCMAIVIGLAAARHESPPTLSLFVLITYLLAYYGISLVLQVYCAAVDAVVVVFAVAPHRLAEENQIIFLRFLRSSESALR